MYSVDWTLCLTFNSLFERLIFMQLASMAHAVQTLTVFVSSPQEAQLAEAFSTAEEIRQRYSKQNREKSQLELEITTLNKSVTLSSLALCSLMLSLAFTSIIYYF